MLYEKDIVIYMHNEINNVSYHQKWYEEQNKHSFNFVQLLFEVIYLQFIKQRQTIKTISAFILQSK